MGEVLKFKPPEREEPHLSGEAVCIGCKHQWVAVAPLGTWQLECPSCGSMKGIFRLPVGAERGKDLEFACTCGCVALTAYMRHGKFWLGCMSCGADCTEAVFG
jgi:hypothetical protein